MRIAVAGIGYVGLSMAVLLSQHNDVTAVDIMPDKTELVNKGKSPIKDKEIEEYLAKGGLHLTATTDGSAAYRDAEYVIISTPTNYDIYRNYFDTSSVETVIKQVISVNRNAVIVIKSTIPVGYTEKIRKSLDYENILFSPEFLREGKALYDNLYPSRIIVGVPAGNEKLGRAAERFADLLQEGAIKENIDVLFMGTTEAEAVKLFANTYLAMRISFFNELDTYAEVKGINTKSVIDGIGADPRIGNYYNNPSFGYGGYCLPKDTKQLLADYDGVPQNMISAVVAANTTRKDFIAGQIIAKHPKTVGIYRLNMKSGSDNFRESAVQTIMEQLKENGIELIIYEPSTNEDSFFGNRVVRDIDEFKRASDVILANRYSPEIADALHKIYTRDLYFRD